MFLSIFIATIRPTNVIGFLNNIRETIDDPDSTEILIKVDKGNNKLVQIIEEYKKTAPFVIKYIASEKLDGYYSLDVGYNELLQMAHPETYFCWLLTDEIRLKTKGWDTILKKYIGFFPDDIFRIKLSIFQAKNYLDFFECLPCPDNYAVTTRKWLEITGGWGNFWGPDSWHQCVDFYLGLCTNPNDKFGIWRSFPLYDIVVEGQEAGLGIEDSAAMRERAIRIAHGWKKHSSHKAQENFLMLAQRLNAHIWATKQNLPNYMIIEDHIDKTVSLLDVNNKILGQWSYSVPRIKINLFVGYKKIGVKRFFSWMKYYIILLNVFPILIKRLIIKLIKLIKLLFVTIPYKIYSIAYKFIIKTYDEINNLFSSIIKRESSKPVRKRIYAFDGKYLRCVEDKIL